MSADAAISIIIPVYNRATLVRDTLDSVKAQTARPLSVILVDNASTDNSLEVLEQWRTSVVADDFKVSIFSETTPGATAARNRGLQEVTTEWTMFFDSDDMMLPGHVERALRVIAEHPEADIVGWNVRYHFADGGTKICPFETDDIVFHNLFHGTFATQRYCVRTALVRKAGGWNVNVPVWNDIELGARLLQLNPTVVHAGDEITIEYRSHEQSISGTSYGHIQQTVEPSLRSIADTLPADKKHWVDMKRAILYATAAREGDASARTNYLNLKRQTASLRLRLTLAAIYHYTRLGGRGAARLLRSLI
jgi:glycosyltransferase involved in cell wall biosynthesis